MRAPGQMPVDFAQDLTVVHILYNRLRTRRPYLLTAEAEDEYFSGADPQLWRDSSLFRDEDLGNMLTAVAFPPMTKAEGADYFGTFALA